MEAWEMKFKVVSKGQEEDRDKIGYRAQEQPE